jgi:hypothetical protein
MGFISNGRWTRSLAALSNEKQHQIKQTLPQEIPAVAGMTTISCWK